MEHDDFPLFWTVVKGSGLGMGVREAVGGEWGIRVLKRSFPVKDLKFRRMCRLIKAFGNIWRGSCKKDVRKKTFEAGMCMKINDNTTHCPEILRAFLSNCQQLCRNSG